MKLLNNCHNSFFISSWLFVRIKSSERLFYNGNVCVSHQCEFDITEIFSGSEVIHEVMVCWSDSVLAWICYKLRALYIKPRFYLVYENSEFQSNNIH